MNDLTIREIWFPEIYLKEREVSEGSRSEIIKLALFVKFLILFDIIFSVIWPVNKVITAISIVTTVSLYCLFAPKIFKKIIIGEHINKKWLNQKYIYAFKILKVKLVTTLSRKKDVNLVKSLLKIWFLNSLNSGGVNCSILHEIALLSRRYLLYRVKEFQL